MVLALLALLSSSYTASAYYDPGVQRWVNRDLIGELGFERIRHFPNRNPGDVRLPIGTELIAGPNLYWFIGNHPESTVDPLGLWQWGWPPWGNPTPKPPPPRRPPPPCELVNAARRIRDACRRGEEPQFFDCSTYCGYLFGSISGTPNTPGTPNASELYRQCIEDCQTCFGRRR